MTALLIGSSAGGAGEVPTVQSKSSRKTPQTGPRGHNQAHAFSFYKCLGDFLGLANSGLL